MNIAIMGVGGVGGYFGGLLAKAGLDVTFVARGEHGEALKKSGLVVKSMAGDFSVNPVKVVDRPDKLETPDLALFTVKTYDTENTAKTLNKVIGEKTLVITFQNGVNNAEVIKSFITKGKIIPGVCYIVSARTAPGVISQTGGLRRLVIPDQSMVDLFKSAGIDALFSDDIQRDLWKKFVFITAFSGMTALTGKTIGEIIQSSEYFQMYEQVVKESISVAHALKINLPDNIFDLTMTTTRNTAPDSKSSLLVDIENRRRTEIETLNGTLIKIANNLQIPVPLNQKIYNYVKSL